MSDEPSLKSKTDVLDLVISFMMEHEKQMDQMLERLARVTNKLSRDSRPISSEIAPNDSSMPRHDIFRITINNPEGYRKMKSLRINWETTDEEFVQESSEVDSILKKIEHSHRDD